MSSNKIRIAQLVPGEPAVSIQIDGVQIVGVRGVTIQKRRVLDTLVTMEIQTNDLEYFEHPTSVTQEGPDVSHIE